MFDVCQNLRDAMSDSCDITGPLFTCVYLNVNNQFYSNLGVSRPRAPEVYPLVPMHYVYLTAAAVVHYAHLTAAAAVVHYAQLTAAAVVRCAHLTAAAVVRCAHMTAAAGCTMHT